MFILLTLLYVLLSSTFIFGSLAMQYTSPAFFIGMRMALTVLFMLSYIIVRRINIKIKLKDSLLVLLLGVVHIFIPLVGEAFALKTLSAAKVSLVWSLSPFVTALFGLLLFGERITKTKLIGLLVGVIGFIPIVVHAATGLQAVPVFFTIGIADAALLMVVVSSAFAWNLFRKLLHRGYRPLVLNTWSMVFASVLSFAFSFFVESWNPLPVTNCSVIFGCLVYLVIIGGLVCYNLYGYMLHHYTATFLSFAGGTIPFLTALLQWLILGKPVSWSFLVSLCIIMMGLFIFYKEELRQRYVK